MYLHGKPTPRFFISNAYLAALRLDYFSAVYVVLPFMTKWIMDQVEAAAGTEWGGPTSDGGGSKGAHDSSAPAPVLVPNSF